VLKNPAYLTKQHTVAANCFCSASGEPGGARSNSRLVGMLRCAMSIRPFQHLVLLHAKQAYALIKAIMLPCLKAAATCCLAEHAQVHACRAAHMSAVPGQAFVSAHACLQCCSLQSSIPGAGS